MGATAPTSPGRVVGRPSRWFAILAVIACVGAIQGTAGASPAGQKSIGVWQSRGLTGGWTTDLVIDPVDPTHMFVGTYFGVFRSITGGRSWRRASAGLPDDGEVLSLVMNLSHPQTLFVGTGGYGYGTGVFRSTNGGSTWTKVLRGVEGEVLAIDPTNHERIYAIAGSDDVYLSEDGGTTWNVIGGIGYRTPLALAIDPVDPALMYVGMENNFSSNGGGVLRSTDGGVSWKKQLHDGLPNSPVFDVTIDPTDHLIAWAAPENGLFRTTDGGLHWSSRQVGMANRHINSVAIDPSDPTTMYAGGSRGSGSGVLFVTNDAGATWTPSSAGSTPAGISGVTLVPGEGRIVVTTGYGVYTPAPGGGWRSWSDGLTTAIVRTIAVSPLGGRVYAGVYPHAVARSADLGTRWALPLSRVPGTDFPFTSIAPDPFDANTVYLGMNLGVFRSRDAGRTWQPIGTGIERAYETHVFADPTQPGRLVAHAQDSVYVSTDAGNHWSKLLPGPSEIFNEFVVVESDPSVIYGANYYHGVFKSTDGGANWAQVLAGEPGPIRATSLAVDPGNQSIVYLGTSDQGVYLSVNGGATWTTGGGGLPPGAPVVSMAVDPLDASSAYAGLYGSDGKSGGVFHSSDGGITWSVFGVASPSRAVLALAIDPSGTWLYAGTEGESVVRVRLR